MVNYDSEAQPLLPNRLQATPLPKVQLAVVLFVRLAEPIAYTQIFPYINAMVEELGIAEPKRVGFYSGIIESLFALVQMCTIVYWSGLSDRIGRKPVIIVGLSGVSVATLCFGLSRTLWQLLLSPPFSTTSVIHCLISDITDETNQSKAFPLLSVIWYIGETIGPFLGGMLSHPAERYPTLFGNFALLRDRPFFLPCLVSVFITVAAILVATFLMEETLPKQYQEKEREQATPQDTLVEPTASGQSTPFGLLADPAVRYVVLTGFCMSFLAIGFDVVFVLWSYTPLALGGLQREVCLLSTDYGRDTEDLNHLSKPKEIGAVLSVAGAVGIASTLVIFPYLHQRFKTIPLFTASLATWGVVNALIPSVGFVIRKVLPQVAQQELAPPLGKLWGFVFCIQMAHWIAAMAWPAYMLVVKESVSDSRSAGALFGLATAANSLGEGTAPAVTS
ncbi:hypothetical protein FRC05_003909 [Tulasnella sp. 425]|nr:hypothetical protein FRC05_003909 [Tulasnella sp. 425]